MGGTTYNRDNRDGRAYCEGRAAAAAGKAAPVAGTGVTGVVGSNNAIEWTAAGVFPVQVVLFDPGAKSSELAVVVSGSVVQVSLETDVQGDIASTATEVYTAVNGDTDASALVTGDDYGASTGAGEVAAASVSIEPVDAEAAGAPIGDAAALTAWVAGFGSWTANPAGVDRDWCADAYGGGFGD